MNTISITTSSKLIVAGAFIIKDQKLLLACRKNSNGNKQYTLIGGKVDPHEAVHAALIREIYEESNLSVKEDDMHLAQVISFKRANGEELISFDFIVSRWSGNIINKEPHKHIDIEWFPLDNLPPELIDRHKIALENYNQGILYSHMGYNNISQP